MRPCRLSRESSVEGKPPLELASTCPTIAPSSSATKQIHASPIVARSASIHVPMPSVSGSLKREPSSRHSVEPYRGARRRSPNRHPDAPAVRGSLPPRWMIGVATGRRRARNWMGQRGLSTPHSLRRSRIARSSRSPVTLSVSAIAISCASGSLPGQPGLGRPHRHGVVATRVPTAGREGPRPSRSRRPLIRRTPAQPARHSSHLPQGSGGSAPMQGAAVGRRPRPRWLESGLDDGRGGD